MMAAATSDTGCHALLSTAALEAAIQGLRGVCDHPALRQIWAIGSGRPTERCTRGARDGRA